MGQKWKGRTYFDSGNNSLEFDMAQKIFEFLSRNLVFQDFCAGLGSGAGLGAWLGWELG